ncbi:MAG TPA: VWA domain-containing protein [Pyrinomonadaceae bacterium]|jgi:VWFA-related protein
MKKSAILSAVLLGCFVICAPAQSGRRAKATPTPAPTPQTANPEEYSDSKPNSSPLILSESKRDKNKKKEKTAEETAPVASPTETLGDEDVVKVETNLITIPVSVYERSGVYVGDLRRSDFQIFEDGKEQEIAYFGNTSQPFTVVLLIDTSSSTTFKIDEIQDAAIAFVEQLNAEDRVMVIAFDSGVNVLTDFTNDRQSIQRAIRKTSFGGGTRLYDAVRTSLNRQLKKVTGRKAVVLFTDGVDTQSGASLNGTLEQAEEADSMIFPIYYNTFLENRGIGGGGGVMSTPPIIGNPPGMTGMPTSADYARGRAYLESLAQLTGGKMFRAESTVGGLNAAFAGIAKELRSQYSIGYYPSDEGSAGQRKQIKVRVKRANVAVRARDSYIVGANESSSKKSSK